MLWDNDSKVICTSSVKDSENIREVDLLRVVSAGVGLNRSGLHLLSVPIGVR